MSGTTVCRSSVPPTPSSTVRWPLFPPLSLRSRGRGLTLAGRFANNIESGGGDLGTNVVWMYKSLAKKGHYRAVEDMDGEGTGARSAFPSPAALPQRQRHQRHQQQQPR
jgi:hypothetical protein